MKELDIYQAVWKKYLPVIAMKIKESQRKMSLFLSLYISLNFRLQVSEKNIV